MTKEEALDILHEFSDATQGEYVDTLLDILCKKIKKQGEEQTDESKNM